MRQMGTKKGNYIVDVKALNLGDNNLKFRVSESFFAQTENAEIRDGDVVVDLLIKKHEKTLELNFQIEGKVEVLCDRCLEWFYIPISFTDELLIKITHGGIDEDEEDDKIWFIGTNEYKVDLTHFIYESIFLSLPIQRYHGMPGTYKEHCNKEMMDKFTSLSIDEKQDEFKHDSRWDKLKDLLSD